MKKTIAISTVVVAILVLSVGAVAAAYSPGTLVGPADDDRGLPTASPLTPVILPAPISYINSIPNPVCDIGEYVYVDATVIGTVSEGDIRLMDVTIGGITYKAGTQVLNLDLDVGNPLIALIPVQQDILIVDADSNGLYSVGDWLYLDINGDGAVTGPSITQGADLRLTSVAIPFGPVYAFGTKVKTLDKDVDLIPLFIVVPGPLVGWRLDYIDNVGPATYTPGDTVYCKLPLSHAAPNVMTCDLRITEYPY